MTNRTHIIVTVVIMASLVVPGAAASDSAKTIYVDDDAAGVNDGTSWENAYVYLQDGLADANTAERPVEIRVAQGIYKPNQGANQTPGDRDATFQLINDVILKGGFAGFGEPDPNAWDVGAYETILSGDLNDNDVEKNVNRDDNSSHVLILPNNAMVISLDGFTITGGNAPFFSVGGGLYGERVNADSNITVRNCAFRGNTGGGMGSAAMFIGGGSLRLDNCLFSNNYSMISSNYKVVMIIFDCNATLTNCTFRDNSAGGKISVGNAVLTNCTFIGNSGGGLDINECNAILINCTFTNNFSGESSGGLSVDSNAIITNCIIWDGTLDISDNTTIRYSDVQGGWPGEGNIDAEPILADPLGPDNIAGTEDDDLRLSPISPCIDAGDPNYMPGPNETDLAGKPRLRYDSIDMGAYEFQGIIYVDDDAPYDPGPGNPEISDHKENGAKTRPMDTIQEAIDIVKDGYTVLVDGGVYGEPIDFKGKAITVTSGSGVAVLEAPGDYAVSFYTAEGPDSILKNFVIRNSLAGVFIPGSSPTIRNLTVVDNEYGITAYTWAEPDISNCIFWNNSEADLFQCQAMYSCIEGVSPGQGNISVNPLFLDASNGDYHLKSEGWCWSTMTQSWTYDYVTSRCIDAGDPDSPLGDEPMSVPRDPDNTYGVNLRINMGAYGGMAQASMPPSLPPSDWAFPDLIAPEPNPAQWAPVGVPRETYVGPGEYDYLVRMTAHTAIDASESVEYFFECTTEPAYSSGWQSSNMYSVNVGQIGQEHRFRFKARDFYGNETAWSEELPAELVPRQ